MRRLVDSGVSLGEWGARCYNVYVCVGYLPELPGEMKKKLISLLSSIFLVYVSIGVLLFVFQRSLLYFPTPRVNHGFTEVVFENEGESIRVVVVNEGNDAAIMYFGGNGEAVAFNAAEFAHFFPDHTAYLVNYRGYGGSTGRPTEAALCSDALAVFDAIDSKHSSISLIGRSLGSGVVTFVAINREIHKLVLVTPFDSVLNVAQKQFWFFPAFLILKDKYDSLSRVKEIRAETMILVAEYDEVINIRFTENLVRAFPASQLRVETIKNAGHNTISEDRRYYDLLQDFI